MDRLDEMRVFVRVVEKRSFRDAAATLGLSRSTVTEAVRRVEARLGTRLLDRTRRPVSVTLDGEAWYRRCLLIIAKVEDAEAAFTGAAVQGRLHIDVPGPLARHFLLPELPAFLSRHPDLKLVITDNDDVADLVRAGVDCIIRAGVPGESDLIAHDIGALLQATAASPRYLKRHGVPRVLADLEGHVAVGHVAVQDKPRRDLHFIADGQLVEPSLPVSLTATDAETAVAAARHGLGLIQAPRYLLAAGLASGSLVEVLADHAPAPLPVAALYPRDRQLSPRVRGFLDWLSTSTFNGRLCSCGMSAMISGASASSFPNAGDCRGSLRPISGRSVRLQRRHPDAVALPRLHEGLRYSVSLRLRTGVKQGFRQRWRAKIRVSLAMQGGPLPDSMSATEGAGYVPKQRSTASSMMSRMSDPLIPEFSTAREAMISRSWASRMKAPRTMPPF